MHCQQQLSLWEILTTRQFFFLQRLRKSSGCCIEEHILCLYWKAVHVVFIKPRREFALVSTDHIKWKCRLDANVLKVKDKDTISVFSG